MAEELPGGCRGGDQPPGDDLGRRTAATGSLLPQEGGSSRMPPPLSSSQSPLSSVSACGENCARSLAPPLPTARGAAGAPLGLAKREMGRARSKEKSVWRAAVQWPSALTEVDVSVQAPILARLRARLGLLRFS
ncbi:hypothetical protein HMPREF1545_04199 [Oscillibacter sp. KLE 1728]|nr:hypothetical protein HMPREF1545_04199 [Oscillibacter sp. KLE 1728]